MTREFLAVNKSDKKRVLQQWRSEERTEALARLPLPPNELRALFENLDKELPRIGCDHTRRITIAWLEANGHAVQPVSRWREETGGFCDCEVLANSEQHFKDAIRGSDMKRE